MIQDPLPEEALKEPEVKPVETPDGPVDATDGKVRVDLACGQRPKEGFKGLDMPGVPGVDIEHDLMQYPWPFEDESVDEARASHFMEHLDGPEQIDFMNELFRVLKTGGSCFIQCPAAFSDRFVQDPTHKKAVVPGTFLYYNKNWREANGLTHWTYAGIKADFDASIGWIIGDEWQKRTAEVRAFAANHYVNVAVDIFITVIKTDRVKEKIAMDAAKAKEEKAKADKEADKEKLEAQKPTGRLDPPAEENAA